VVVDTRRGDGPPGAGNYSFAALATTESNIETKRERIEAVIRAVVRAHSVLRLDPLRVTAVTKKLFPPVEAELMGQILARDAEFYQFRKKVPDTFSVAGHPRGVMVPGLSRNSESLISFSRRIICPASILSEPGAQAKNP
jgi:ABC-type nitrate/sulfonate/bicarbonate transport system substrate-binding protein